MSEVEFTNESLKKSSEAVGALYPVIVSEDGEVLDGKHRLEVNPNWPQTKNPAKTKREKILVRIHGNYRRRVSREETQALILELAKELEVSGVPKESISTELGKLLPFSEAYIRMLLPTEYKHSEKVEAAKIGAQIVVQTPSMPPVPCSIGNHINLVYPKYWKGHAVCEEHYGQLSRGEITLEVPKLTPALEETARVEKKVFETPDAWKDETRRPISPMDHYVAGELSRQGLPIEIKQPICVETVIPKVTVNKGDKPLCIFLDNLAVPKTLRDMENRVLLKKRGYRVLQIEYSSYTEQERQTVMSEIVHALSAIE